MKFRRRHHHKSLALSCLGWTGAVILLFATAWTGLESFGWPYYRIELWTQDWVARHSRPAPIDPRLMFLAEDEASHSLDSLWEDEIAASPVLRLMKKRFFPREVWAQVLDRLTAAGARVVALDYMFQHEDDGDPAFRAALERHRDRVVIGSQIEEKHLAGKTERRYVGPSKTLVPPSLSDDRVGIVNVWKDPDGIVRRARFRVTREGASGLPSDETSTVLETFAARIARKAGEADRIPTGLGSQIFRYAFKGEMLQAGHKLHSLYEIFVPAFWTQNYGEGAAFKDKIVLIGPEGNWSKDVGESPFGTIAGPEFHLNALNALLQNEFLRETPVWLDFVLIGAGGAISWLLGFFIRSPVPRLLLMGVGAGGWFASAIALHNSGWVMPVFSPVLALAGSTFIFSIAEQVLERLEKARLRRTFERYVSRDVVKELLDNPATYLNTLGGVRKNITVLFSDVRGFTTMTETADPTLLVAQLNEYFTEMVRIVFAHYGTLDKFIGDAVMAQWGSILSEGEKKDACRAVGTALQMQRALAKLNESWRKRNMPELKFGIGINHGEAIVGNLGSEEKREFSAIGDAVNLASRLEGATKEYHVDLLIGERVALLVRDAFILRSVDLLKVKGKSQPVEVFTVLAERDGAVEPAWLESWEEGVQLYRKREFEAATELFAEVGRLQPGDVLCEDYEYRAANYAANPPTPEWDGVYVMTRK